MPPTIERRQLPNVIHNQDSCLHSPAPPKTRKNSSATHRGSRDANRPATVSSSSDTHGGLLTKISSRLASLAQPRLSPILCSTARSQRNQSRASNEALPHSGNNLLSPISIFSPDNRHPSAPSSRLHPEGTEEDSSEHGQNVNCEGSEVSDVHNSHGTNFHSSFYYMPNCTIDSYHQPLEDRNHHKNSEPLPFDGTSPSPAPNATEQRTTPAKEPTSSSSPLRTRISHPHLRARVQWTTHSRLHTCDDQAQFNRLDDTTTPQTSLFSVPVIESANTEVTTKLPSPPTSTNLTIDPSSSPSGIPRAQTSSRSHISTCTHECSSNST